jgi:hypothetical protein
MKIPEENIVLLFKKIITSVQSKIQYFCIIQKDYS